MKLGMIVLGVLGTIACMGAEGLWAAPLSTSFTYQAQVKPGGAPLNATADFRFSLWSAETNGAQVGSTIIVSDVTVTDGLFTTELDFGAAGFNGDGRWLKIRVRSPHDQTNTAPFATLSPRQAVSPPHPTHFTRVVSM